VRTTASSGVRTVGVPACERAGDVDVHRVLVVRDAAEVGHGRVHAQLLALAHLAPLLAVRVRHRARVCERGRGVYVEVADSGHVHTLAGPQVRAVEVAVQCDGAVALPARRADGLAGGQVLKAVREQVRVSVAEDERAELEDAEKAGEVEDLAVGVAAVEDAGKVEELCTGVDLGPEALLERLFCVLERRGLADEVEVGEHAENLREAVRLEDIQKFERFLRRGGRE
jgi:hypothetical protein